MSAVNISLNPDLFNWLKQSAIFRFILPGTKSSGRTLREIESSVLQKNESGIDLSSCCRGKSALITGATSGIGKEFAFSFARRGYDLIITGRRKHKISLVASELRDKYDVRVDVIIADLSVRNDLNRLLKFIEKRQDIEVLVNNAGYGLSEKFTEDRINNQLKMLKVHVTAPLLIIHKILPQMISQRKGSIINVTSLAAWAPNSGNTMYTSTKSFLTNFTESLFMDLNPYGIRVQCLCPGFARTDFHNHLRSKKELASNHFIHWMEPSAVVKYSLSCLETGKIVCIPGMINKMLIGLISILPRRLYYFLIGILSPKNPVQVKYRLSA